MDKQKEANQKEHEIPASNTSFSSRLLNSAFIDKYDITTALVSKIFWPFVVLILAISFSTELSTILYRLSKTTIIRVGDNEILIPSDLFSVQDPDAYKLIKKLNRDELECVLWLAGIGVNLKSTTLSADDSRMYEALHQHELIYFTDADGNLTDLVEADSLKQTEMGKRVYRELGSILVSVVAGISNAQESQP
ncbi:hypothetical protein [Sphaerothrix gracilis]|uniref:hypothetical protein n=1 Tax=Sphaerothrix gracilis TaxID=3151835 RepID=UPI0031FC7D18